MYGKTLLSQDEAYCFQGINDLRGKVCDLLNH